MTNEETKKVLEEIVKRLPPHTPKPTLEALSLAIRSLELDEKRIATIIAHKRYRNDGTSASTDELAVALCKAHREGGLWK